MKRVKIFVAFLLLIALTVIGLFACNDKQTETELGALSFTADENGITFSFDGSISLYYSVDGGENVKLVSGFVFDFSEEIGEHVVSAYAQNEAGEKIAEGTFTYTTAAVSLSDLTVSGKTVSWTAAAKTVSAKEDGNYLPVTGSSFTATADDATVYVKAEGGYDVENAVYYVGDQVIKSARVIPDNAALLASPKLKFSGKSITWTKATNATGYKVSYDDGRFQTATSATISDTIGDHTIAVKAIGDGVYYADSNVTIYTYKTVRAKVQVSKVATNKVILFTECGSFDYSTNGTSFSALSGSAYTANATSTVYFRTDGGFDKDAQINYVQSEKATIDLLVDAENDYVVDDAERGVTSRWSVKALSGQTWQNTNVTLSTGERYDGSAALRLNARNDDVSYKFAAAYSALDAYDYLSFYYRGDGVSSLNLSFTKEGNSFSVSRDLGIMPAYWVKVTLRFEDEGWTCGSNALQTLWSAKNSEIEAERPVGVPQRVTDAYSTSELFAYFDRLNFVVRGNVSGGAQPALLLDDVIFGYDEAVESGIEQPLYALGRSYVAYEDLDGGVQNELILFLDDGEVFRLYSTKLTENFTLNGSYRLYEEDAILRFDATDPEFSMTVAFAENGKSAVVRSVSGAHAEHFASRTFEKAASLDLDFSGDESAALKNWSAYTYVTDLEEWNALSTAPVDVTSGVLCFSTGKDLTNKIVFNEGGEKLGLANYFSFDVGNYDVDADDILVKFIATDVNGGTYYLKGSAGAYWTCSAGSELVPFEHTLQNGIYLASLAVIVEYRGSKPISHLYLDNLKAEYHADPSLFSDYAAPTIEKGEYALTFTHTERARIEYSVNWSEEWTEGETYTIPADAGAYTIRVRAVIEANGAVSQVETYSFTVEKVHVSQLTVNIDPNGQTATWTSNGIVSLRVDEKVGSAYQPGEYSLYNGNSYFTDKNVVLNVRASGYFDEDTDTYYVGTVEISKKIIVDAVLSAPTITPTEQGITWDEVADANAYAVSVNGGDEVIREDRTLAFAIYEGSYSVRVKAVLLENGEVTAYGNFSNAYTYSVKNVSLSTPVVDKDTATWSAEAYEVYVGDNDGEFVKNDTGRFTALTLGAHNFVVRAIAGFSLSENVYYYAEQPVEKGGVIVVENLLTPTLLLNSTNNGLYWAYLDDDGEVVHTVADMRSVYPFLVYRISVNGGEWFDATGDEYAFPSVSGEYSVRVMAKGNDANYRDSEASAVFSFEVKVLSLTDIAVEKGASESTATYDYVALSVRRKIGLNGAFFPTTEKSFSASATTWIAVRVEGGWDEANGVYYAGNAIEKEKQVIVPIRLATPVLTNDSQEISWNKVDHATGYRILINDVPEQEILKTTSYTYSTANGDYVVKVIAVNENESEQYPDSEAATITYHVSTVALGNITFVGATISWEHNGLLYMYVGNATPSANDWTPYAQSEYVNESGNEATVWLEARAGYRSISSISGNEVFIYRGATVQGKQVVANFSLVAPVLTKSGNTLSWTANANATCYKYKMLPIDAAPSDIADAESDLSDWTELASNVTSYTFDKAVDNNKLLLLKAIGNGNNITDSPTTICGLRVISLSEVTVSNGVASWTKSGITTIQKITKGQSGNLEYSDYEEIRTTSFAPEATMKINLKCSAGYDATDAIWYFGDTIEDTFKETILRENVEIIVAIKLATPTVEMRDSGVYLGTVAYFDAYKVQVNDGAVQTVSKNDRVLSFANEAGNYTLTIYACNTAEPVQYPDSDPVQFTYSVKTVALSAITADNVNGAAVFTADGILFAKKGEGEFVALTAGATSYAPEATVTVTIQARAGTDVENKVVYIGESKEGSQQIIVPIQLATPVLNEGVDEITIGAVTNATGYSVKVDNGEWMSQTSRLISYPTAVGEHTVYVKAISTNNVQYPDSDAVSTTFTTTAVSLSGLTKDGATLSWDAVAYSVRIKVNSGDYEPISLGYYTATTAGTTNVYVRAYRGFLSSERVYYTCANSYLQESGSVTVSKLDKPTLSVSGSKITWNAISGANGYEVKVGNGSYVSQTATEKALSNQEGKYKVYVRAKGNGSTVLSSDAATIEYTTKNVTLSDISVVGTTASWSAVAYKTSLSLNGGSYSETTATSYTPTTEGTHTVKVKAEGGWNNNSKVYYYTNKAIEKSATIKLYKLSKPNLTTNSSGIVWDAVSNATTYSVKLDNGSFKTQTSRSVSFNTSSGMHTVYVQAIGSASSGYQDSEIASFTYETKQTSLTFLSSDNTSVTWICVGLKAQYSTDGNSYSDAKYSGYTATANGQVSFRAIGGYDSSAKTYYYGTSSVQKKTFTLPGLCIGNNFEAGTGSWTKEVYNTDGWANTTATEVKSVADATGSGSAIMFKSYMNSMAYRFGYHFGNLPATYKSLSFDIRLNEYTGQGTTLRFQDSDGGGTYVDYSLNHLSLDPGVWYHVTIYFEDDNLVINMGGTEYKPSQAINNALVGRTKFYEKIKALDHMYVTIKGTVSGNPAAYTYIDNFQFSTNSASTGKTRLTGKEYGFNNGTVGSNYTASGYKAYKYGGSGFEENPNVLKIESGRKALSLYCGGTTTKMTYNVGGSVLGEFNHFAIDIGTEASSVSYSIELVTESGSSIYVAGGEEYRATLSNTDGANGMKTVVFNFASTKIRSIIVYASESTGNGHFYMDNIIFTKL